MPVIDCHVHTWINDPKFPWAPENTNPPREDATAEILLKHMDANGVEKTVIVQVIHYLWDNSYTSDCIKRYPDRFEGVCRVNPLDPEAPEHLTMWVEEHQFRGVRLSPSTNSDGDWIVDGTTDAIWERARDLGVPMTILTGMTRMPDIQKMADKNEGLTVVVDHMAFPDLEQTEQFSLLLDLADNPNVYVKVSGMWSPTREEYPYRDCHDTWKRAYDAFGPQRLMWGTDWPVSESKLTYGQALELIRDKLEFLTEEDKKWILGGTALKLWPFDRG